ncbi:hypothetical protein [Primorskyibacter sp. S87]
MLETCLVALITLSIVLYWQARSAAREIRRERGRLTVDRMSCSDRWRSPD